MICITGSTGLLGSHLLFQLVKTGEDVRAIRRPTSDIQQVKKIFSYYVPEPEKYFSKIEWVEGNILDMDSLEDAFKGVEKVYHTAAVVTFNPQDKERVLETNIKGTANVVNACLQQKVKKLCFVSSVAALGRTGNGEIITESSEWKPERKASPYAVSKFESEREVWRGIAEGLKAVIVNPSIILGPGNFSQGSSKMFQTVYNGLKFYTGGVNGYVDVNDVAKAMILLMESNISGERFILNSENLNYKTLFGIMAESLKVKPPKYKAGKTLSELTWRVLRLKEILTGTKPLITKQTAQAANRIIRYSSEKFMKATGMEFIPITKTIQYTSEIFLKNE